MIVGESIGLLWVYRAEGTTERIAAGILMTLVVLAYLAVALVGKTGTIPTRSKPPGALGATSPAKEVVTQEQINNPEPEVFSAPDGSYQIAKPPDMNLLRPFEELARYVDLDFDEELNELWRSLRKAEVGDASDFKVQVSEWIANLSEEEDSEGNSELENS